MDWIDVDFLLLCLLLPGPGDVIFQFVASVSVCHDMVFGITQYGSQYHCMPAQTFRTRRFIDQSLTGYGNLHFTFTINFGASVWRDTLVHINSV